LGNRGYIRLKRVILGKPFLSSLMSVWKTYYHLVWATADRQPLILETSEPDLYRYISTKCRLLNCPLHAVGGTVDHIHLVVSIPPSLSIAEFVKQIKGSSSRWMNQSQPNGRFAWQREYGVFSLGSKQLEQAVAYVEHQKQHHASGNLIQGLEPEIFNDSTKPARE
jgi:putative transposase